MSPGGRLREVARRRGADVTVQRASQFQRIGRPTMSTGHMITACLRQVSPSTGAVEENVGRARPIASAA